MWAMRKPKKTQTDKERLSLALLFKHSPVLETAYNFSQQLTSILDTKTSRNGGIRRLKNWINKVNQSDTDCYKTFIGTLEKWMDEVANYFVERENSGFVEGFNNRIKVLKRRCYGIVDRKHLYQRITLDLKISLFSF
jgi:transposase